MDKVRRRRRAEYAGKDTICMALTDETCKEPKIRMIQVIQSNLKVFLGDVISIHKCLNVKYDKHMSILPTDDTIENTNGS